MSAFRFSRPCLVLGASSLTIYVATLFPGVGGILNHGDSAKFQFLGYVPGVGHPPGNPLYLAIMSLVQRAPLGTAATRASLSSALMGALAVTFVAEAAYRLAGKRGATLTALCLALGGLFWEFATEAEVYALNGALVGFVLYSLVRAEQEASATYLAAACGAFLLGIANHLSIVVAFPALALAIFRLHRRGVRLSRRGLLCVGACAATSVLLYASLPFVHERSVYSEYPNDGSLRAFLMFVTGAKWQSRLGLSSLEQALTTRSVNTVSVLLRNWTLVLWAGVPVACLSFFRRSPAAATFAGVALGSWLAFLYLYDIPDPDGLVIPMVVCAAPALGVAAAESRRPNLLTGLLILALLPSAVLHARKRSEAVGFEILEDVGDGPAREVLDLPDIVARLPEKAFFTLPCLHYGCVQVLNYFRFADVETRRREIEIVGLRGSAVSRWASSPRAIDPSLARTHVVCTIHERESQLLARHGARMRKVERGHVQVRGKDLARLPLYCSTGE